MITGKSLLVFAAGGVVTFLATVGMRLGYLSKIEAWHNEIGSTRRA